MRSAVLSGFLFLSSLAWGQLSLLGVGGPQAAAGGAITWTLIQHKENFACTGTNGSPADISCAVTVTSTGAGHLLLAMSSMFVTQALAPTFTSVTGDGTWTHCPSQMANLNYSANNWENADCAYILSSTGGATTITYTWHIGGAIPAWFIDVEVLEVSRSTGTATYETCGGGGATDCTIITPNPCTACTGPVPTVTGNADFVAQWNASENDCSAVASPYNTSPSPVFDHSNVTGAYSWSLSQTSGNAASWTCTSGGVPRSAAAFK